MSEKSIKCVVWDLDNTVWNGVLLEGDDIELNLEVVGIIQELDKRGILNSIASRNIFDEAWEKLKEFNMEHFFLYPEISMQQKSTSIKNIANNLNISLDSIAFIDDQEYELEEVSFVLKEVNCFQMREHLNILELTEFNPRFITQESSQRRELYHNDIIRKNYELETKSTQGEFLESLNLKLFVTKAGIDDLKRAEELTIRTHQLNSTGITYDYNELVQFADSKNHTLLVSELSDKFGSYGKIGVTLIEKNEEAWYLKLHLMSCRVMSRGVGNVILIDIIRRAIQTGVKLYADFNKTDRNKNMYLAYKFLGFTEVKEEGAYVRFMYNGKKEPQLPGYVELVSTF